MVALSKPQRNKSWRFLKASRLLASDPLTVYYYYYHYHYYYYYYYNRDFEDGTGFKTPI
jgi:hypothetical protein